MGIVNVTPDSFSDGGLLYPRGHPAAAVAHARRLVDEGADLLDIGGESTRPGSDPVDETEELRRVLPVLEQLAASGPVVLSIDTTKAAVARAAVAAGARIVNDVSGGRSRELLQAVADTGAAYVLMHTRGTPKDMQRHAGYADVVAEVYEYLAEGLRRCAAAGIDEEAVIIDPGLGFAKTAEHNLALLRALRQFRSLGRPVLVGASRKSFLGRVLDEAAADDRLEGSLAAAAAAVAAGGAVLRVHDVAGTVRVARVTRAIVTGELDWPPAARAAHG
jgi:dihydropteroate synthase